MPKSHSPYPPEFRQQMVELVRAGRSPGNQKTKAVKRPWRMSTRRIRLNIPNRHQETIQRLGMPFRANCTSEPRIWHKTIFGRK